MWWGGERKVQAWGDEKLYTKFYWENLNGLGTSRRRLEGYNNLNGRELISAETDVIELQYVPWYDFAWPDDERLNLYIFLNKILQLLIIYG